MTIDFLRARLLSERSVSRASKERADQLAARVAELEEQVRAVTEQRRQAEQEAAEVLAILESKGFCGSLSDALDAGSDNDDGASEEARPRDAETTGGDAARSNAEEEQDQEPAAAKSEADDDATSAGTAPQHGGLSWKGRSVSPRKARQLRQRHRRSYAYLLAAEDPSPKYRMGQSCRKNKRKELSSGRLVAPEEGRNAVLNDDGRAEFDGEVAGDERSSGDGSGQYVIRCQKDGEMERVLEKQAELIGQYEAEERAQRDWEKKFNDNRSSPEKGDAAQPKSSGKTLSIAGNASEECAGQRREAGEQHGRGRAQNAAISEANSDGCPSHNTNSATSGHKSSPSSDTMVSKVSDWSSSRFHDHADDQLDTAQCQQSSSTKDIDVESVLQALQRARISLQQKLGRPLPPSQVTLALPAPGDEYRTDEDLYHDDGSGNSYRGEPGGSSPSRQEMLALPAPEDYHSCNDHDHGSLVDGADSSSLTEKRSSPSTPRQEVLALPAPGDDEREDDVDVKIPFSSPGLFRLPTDSFLEEDEMMPRSNGCDFELGLRHHAYRDDGDAGVSARQFYDPPHGCAPASGRCSVPQSSGFTVGGASFLDGIPGLPKELRRNSIGDADLFMQRACDYTITNKWML
ncbi:hypothetical protein QYE76_056495 [Lolium multiflorum]|uniref:Uncharacterized protein n=1 Tax=Lolium multiflorum TaxID=4521 RepID=A0AAD8WN86_LOLMU|nr:hypothetical protein QYE76_056495 [Lolium multiflorum]